MIKMQAFFGNGDQQVGRYGNPYLRLHRVLAGAEEHLDAQMLLDPLEEQFHLPALAVQVGDQLRFQGEVVGQKHQSFAGVVLDHHPAHRRGIVLSRKMPRQHAGLVAQHRCIDSIHRVRVTPLELGVALRSGHEECFGFVNHEQTCKVQIAPIHQVKGSRLQHQIVHDVDLVGLAVGDVNETWDVAPQIEQGVQFDGGLGRAKRCPCKHRQAQVDGAGVEGIHSRIELHAKGLRGVQGSCNANQVLSEVGKNLPRACGVRIGQRVARNRLTAKPHVVQPPCLGTQIDFDIAQGFAVGQLGEGHGEELVQTREVFDLVFPIVIGHTAAKGTQRQVQHELREHELALVHGNFCGFPPKNPKSDFRRSNRDQTETPNSPEKSLTYDAPTLQRWDTTGFGWVF